MKTSNARRSRGRRVAAAPLGVAALAGLLGIVAITAALPPALAGTTAGRAAATVPGSNITVYHGNLLGTGVENSATRLRPLRDAWRSPVLDGDLYGEPLEFAGRVYAATEDDTVYAFAADSGRVIWSTHIATPVPTSSLPCSDISPMVGVTGTPVIDVARGEIFVVADESAGAGLASHHLVGLDLDTGKIDLNESVNPPGSTPTALLQRTGLTLDRGNVVVGFGGNYGDCNNYHGTIAAVPAAGGTPRYFTFDTAPGERQGSIWMGGAAPLVDAAGNIWFATGNGSQSSPPYDYADSVTELSASLRREQTFAPSNWEELSRDDLDLGSAAPAFVDGYIFQVGKSHIAYLLDATHLGGIGGQVAAVPLCSQDPAGGEAVLGRTVYVGCGNGVTALRISRQAPYMRVLWTTASSSSGAAISGPPIIADGLVWSLDQYGTLWGLDPANGAHVLSEQTGAGEANHFPTPAVADGLLLAPTTDQVFAFEGPTGRPGPPTS
jgi:outer membrane protein assembly factor BamB